MIQGCLKGVSRVSKGCLKGVSSVFQGCFKCVSNMSQGCFKDVSWVLCFKGVSKFFGCFRKVCFSGVSRKFSGKFKGDIIMS